MGPLEGNGQHMWLALCLWDCYFTADVHEPSTEPMPALPKQIFKSATSLNTSHIPIQQLTLASVLSSRSLNDLVPIDPTLLVELIDYDPPTSTSSPGPEYAALIVIPRSELAAITNTTLGPASDFVPVHAFDHDQFTKDEGLTHIQALFLKPLDYDDLVSITVSTADNAASLIYTHIHAFLSSQPLLTSLPQDA
ncbi:hypothetical protein H2248_002824 [Termitomyces sp. 'cryptogamus']|nr:hypothetical protein H2248_002824 [Termitomyces sp. 'cryptogamus']